MEEKSGTTKSILDLNSFCLFAIFKQIQNNCELKENTDRYRDLIYFSIAHDYFRSAFLDWSEDLWERLEDWRLLAGNTVVLDLAKMYESTKKYTKSEKLKFWDILCTSLKENPGLWHCVIRFQTNSYYPEHMETFERIIKILKEKENLETLNIKMQTYSAGNLENFRNLRLLSLTTPMEAESLVDCLKSNPNLEKLMIISTEIYGRLADIAPYCKNIHYLNIQMKPDSNAIEYAPLTHLPKLSSLSLGGSPQTDSLGSLFKSMADNCSRTLKTLTIDHPIESGIEELSKIRHLQELDCHLKEPPLDLNPRQLWQLPIIGGLDLKMNPTEDNKKQDHISVDILSNKGILFLTSRDMTFIRRILLRLKNWYQRHRGHSHFSCAPMCFEMNEMRSTIESLRSQDISNSKDTAKMAKFALLKTLENQWPTHAQNIQLLARIGDLKELRLAVKLNIERELMQLNKSDIRLHVEEFEKEIPIDSDTQEIIYLAVATYLRSTLVIAKFARIETDIVLRNLEMTIRFDIRI